MAIRSNHYEAAFEEYLRHLRVPYVTTDERRRALLADASLKSPDFIVDTPAGPNLLVDVKGRKFGAGSRRWESWATDDDLAGLGHWQRSFGDDFRATLVFAYQTEEGVPSHCRPWDHAGRTYFFVAADLTHYAAAARVRSDSWNTVSVPTARFRQIARPLERLLCPLETSERQLSFISPRRAAGN